MRLITHDGALAKLAFWSSFLGVLVISILFVPELIDWLSSDRHTRTRRAGAAPLTMHVAAIAPLALGVYERLHLAAATHAAAVAGVAPTLTKLDAWPMALAVAGGLAWLLGGWMAEEKMERVRYQPTGFPTRA